MPDHPDDFDRRLAQRLRAYDSGFPAGRVPDPVLAVGRNRWRAIAAIAGGAVLAGVIVAAFLSGPNSNVGQSSSSPTPTPTTTPTPSISPLPPTPTATANATPSPAETTVPTGPPTPAPTPPPPLAWSLAASFGDGPDQPHFVFDATVWNGGYVAIGVRLDAFANDCCAWFGDPVLWVSPDGSRWEQRPLPIDPTGGIHPDDNRISRIVTLPDGRLMATAAAQRSSTAWISDDAVNWSPVQILPAGTSVIDIAAGPRGLVLVASDPSGAQQLWYSAEGMAWDLVHESGDEAQFSGALGAGPEGFVVAGARFTSSTTEGPYVLASSDGRTWYTAPQQPAFAPGDVPYDVAPLGADWVATGFGADEADRRAVVWRSEDGLHWSRDLGPRDPSDRDSFHATDIAGADGVVVLSPAVSQISGPFQFPTYAWSSTDGVGWSLIEPDRSYVTEVVTNGSTMVAVGTIGRGDRAAFWVTDR